MYIQTINLVFILRGYNLYSYGNYFYFNSLIFCLIPIFFLINFYFLVLKRNFCVKLFSNVPDKVHLLDFKFIFFLKKQNNFDLEFYLSFSLISPHFILFFLVSLNKFVVLL